MTKAQPRRWLVATWYAAYLSESCEHRRLLPLMLRETGNVWFLFFAYFCIGCSDFC